MDFVRSFVNRITSYSSFAFVDETSKVPYYATTGEINVNNSKT